MHNQFINKGSKKVKDVIIEGKLVFCPKRPESDSPTTQQNDKLDNSKLLTGPTKLVFTAQSIPILIVKKTHGAIRICGDLSTGLSEPTQAHQHLLGVPEDLFAKTNTRRVFSNVDLQMSTCK